MTSELNLENFSFIFVDVCKSIAKIIWTLYLFILAIVSLFFFVAVFAMIFGWAQINNAPTNSTQPTENVYDASYLLYVPNSFSEWVLFILSVHFEPTFYSISMYCCLLSLFILLAIRMPRVQSQWTWYHSGLAGLGKGLVMKVLLNEKERT